MDSNALIDVFRELARVEARARRVLAEYFSAIRSALTDVWGPLAVRGSVGEDPYSPRLRVFVDDCHEIVVDLHGLSGIATAVLQNRSGGLPRWGPVPFYVDALPTGPER